MVTGRKGFVIQLLIFESMLKCRGNHNEICFCISYSRLNLIMKAEISRTVDLFCLTVILYSVKKTLRIGEEADIVDFDHEFERQFFLRNYLVHSFSCNLFLNCD